MTNADKILAGAHEKQPIAKPTPLVAPLLSDKPQDYDKKPISGTVFLCSNVILISITKSIMIIQYTRRKIICVDGLE